MGLVKSWSEGSVLLTKAAVNSLAVKEHEAHGMQRTFTMSQADSV